MSKEQNYRYESSSQTAGPYVHIGLQPSKAGFKGFQNEFSNDLTADTDAKPISIAGIVYDGGGEAVKDALLELWQADENGYYAEHYTPGKFRGWGRASADFDTGEYRFKTIKPGQVRFDNNTLMAPHICLWVAARGINLGLHTRMYFPEHENLNEEDPVLKLVNPQSRISTLIATTKGEAEYVFDIHLQGEKETVFFDV